MGSEEAIVVSAEEEVCMVEDIKNSVRNSMREPSVILNIRVIRKSWFLYPNPLNALRP